MATPRLIVLDLDATLWLPELYSFRRRKDEDWSPILGRDVKVFEDVSSILDEMRSVALLGIASRTSEGRWARSLVSQLKVGDDTLEKICDNRIQIFPGDKQTHFRKLQKITKIPFEDMLFFDDALGGRYGNCRRVSKLGVTSCHTPQGLTRERWKAALDAFQHRRGTVVLTSDLRSAEESSRDATIELPCVSLALPFAALVLNGAKTIETRHSPIFEALRGQRCLVRVGKKDWLDDYWKSLASDESKGRLHGEKFRRGDIAGIVDIGLTTIASDDDWPAMEKHAMAQKSNCGEFATKISNPTWFHEGIPAPGRPGIYSASVPRHFI